MYYGDGVKFIAGRNFDTEYGHHEAGTVVEDAPKFPNLDVLVSASFLYPYAPDAGYAYLPPHIFNSVNTREEVEAKVAGDTTPYSAARGVANVQYPGGKPEVVEQAEREAELQHKARALVLAQHEARTAPKADAQETPKKVAVKKAAPAHQTAKKAAPSKEK